MKTDTDHNRLDEKTLPNWLVAFLVALLLALVGLAIWAAMTTDSVTTWPSLMY